MAVKLRLAWQSQILRLTFKPAGYGLLLLGVWLADFHLMAIAVFWLVNLFFYFHPLVNSLALLNSFLIFLFLSLPALKLAGSNLWLLTSITVFLCLLYYWFFGLKNLILAERKSWHYLLNLGLFYLLLLVFFGWPNNYFWLKMAGFLLLAFILIKQFLKSADARFFDHHYKTIFLIVICLLLGELAWLMSWLPIGNLMAANLFFLAVYFLENFLKSTRLN
jgi:hypothetical protein